jgi:hypothetical protein
LFIPESVAVLEGKRICRATAEIHSPLADLGVELHAVVEAGHQAHEELEERKPEHMPSMRARREGRSEATHFGGELRVLRVAEVREGRAGVHDGGELRCHRLAADADGREANVVRRAAQAQTHGRGITRASPSTVGCSKQASKRQEPRDGMWHRGRRDVLQAPDGERRLGLAAAAGVAEVDAADAVVAEAHGEAVGRDEAAGGERAGHGHLAHAEPHEAVDGAAAVVQERARLHLPAPEHDGRLQGLPGGAGARALPCEVEHVLHQHPGRGRVGGHVLDLVRAAAVGRGGASVAPPAQRVVARHLLARRRPPRAVGAQRRRVRPRRVGAGDGRALPAVARHPEEVAAGVQRHQERRVRRAQLHLRVVQPAIKKNEVGWSGATSNSSITLVRGDQNLQGGDGMWEGGGTHVPDW